MYFLKNSTLGWLREAFSQVACGLAHEALDATNVEVRVALAVALVCEASDDGRCLKWKVVGKEVLRKACALAQLRQLRDEQANRRFLSSTYAQLSKDHPALLAAVLVTLIESAAVWLLSPPSERDLPHINDAQVGFDEPCTALLAQSYRSPAQALLALVPPKHQKASRSCRSARAAGKKPPRHAKARLP
jgi:hypothetical protein